MRLMTRYVLAELSKIFLVTLALMTLLMIIVGVVAEAARQGLGPAQVVRLLPYILPNALRFTIPGTILFAAAYVYGRMSSSNEIVALKSAGISPMVVLWPAFALAAALSFLSVWLNDVAVSWGVEGLQRVAIESVEDIAYSMLRTQRSYSTKEFSINVKRVDGRKLILPTVIFQPKGDRPALTIMADYAEMTSDLKAKELRIAFHNFTMDGGEQVRAQDPGVVEIPVPLTSASRADQRAMIPAQMPLRMIPERYLHQSQKLHEYQQELAFRGATALFTGNFAALSSHDWKGRYQRLFWDCEDIYKLRTEPHRRWASGFSCLAFVVVGAATAIKRRNSDFLTSFFVCFLPILIVYYPLLAFGLDSAKNGTLPPSIVWLGNGIMAVWGVHQTRWVLRY
jgi:lipopolysaccharide export system permease protein